MKKIKNLRQKIDRIDGNILSLLNQRAEVTIDIGKLKNKEAKPTFSPVRENEVYARLKKANKGPLCSSNVEAIYREIMSGSRALQENLRIAYLGPEATFTHIAALKKFGKSVKYISANSIGDVFTEVERQRADYGVVPIENSTEGAVNHTLDMFVDSDLQIYSEVYLPIEHNLLSKAKNMASIKRVFSHPQVFGQCRIWLETNLPRVELIEVPTTTRAAYRLANPKDSKLAIKPIKGEAAIASRLAAERYKLNMLARSIQDSSHNITRFLVIGKHEAEPTKKNKTSICFSMKDKSGALHDILAPFKKAKINLTKIESRPSKKKAWKYYFYVDMEGHTKDKKIAKSIDQLKRHCKFLRVLGSYPAA